MVAPSFDQTAVSTLRSKRSVRLVCRPDARSRSIRRHLSDSYPARAWDRYAIVRPSGEYAGDPSNPGFVVSRLAVRLPGDPGAVRSTSNKSAFVLVASTRSVIAVKQ